MALRWRGPAGKRPAGWQSGLLYALAGAGVTALLFLTFARPPQPVAPSKPARETAARQSVPVPAPLPRPSVVPRPAPAPSPVLPAFPRGSGKIAIVLDDWGYTLKRVPELNEIRAPLTVAVLPGLPHSAEVANNAAGHGHEVILHMPMEAVGSNEPREEGRTILQGMSRSEILKLLDRSLATVPHARGINNHQGSRVTADPASMKVILTEVKRRRLYFLDSLTGKSVCPEVARQVKVPFAQRAVFLDNESSVSHIREQLVELAKTASEKGEAIGIGHDRPATVECVRAAVPELEKAGYTLVPVSELTEQQ